MSLKTNNLFHFHFPLGILVNFLDKILLEWLFKILDRFVRYEAPLVDDGKGVTDRFHIGEDMGIEKYGCSPGFEFQNQVFNHLATDGIESAHRLVEKHDGRIVDDRLPESDTLEHSLGVLCEEFISRSVESHFVEYLLDSRVQIRVGDIEELSVEAEEFASGQVFVEVSILRHKPDFPFGLIGEASVTEDTHTPIVRSDETEYGFHGGGFPCPVRSEESEYFACCNREIDIGEHPFPVEVLVKICNEDRRGDYLCIVHNSVFL